MAPRNPRLEQKQPKGDSPAKVEKRRASDRNYREKGFSAKDLPRGTVTQHRAKPGMTSPQ